MPLHFPESEYTSRIKATQAEMRSRGLDVLLLFSPESQYYLTGYDTFGFALFQCIVLPVDAPPHLLTRAPDLRQAQQTSTLDDDRIHIWIDRQGVEPVTDLVNLLSDLGITSGRVGVEQQTVGLTAWNGAKLATELKAFEQHDASDLVQLLRRVKSPLEIECTRKAATLSDAALDAGIAATGAGAFEGDILAEMQGAVFVVAVITPVTNLSSDQDKVHCCVDTFPADARSTRLIN